MLDWLRRPPADEPTIAVGDRLLPLVVRRMPQARRMTMRLAPDGSEVRITVPQWGRTAEALAFARSKADWLAAQLDALPPAGAAIVPGGSLPFRGLDLTIAHDPRAPRRPFAGEAELRIGGPAESLPTRLRRWLESEARTLLTEDLSYYCLRASLPTPRLSLTSAQRRWGSCSGHGHIRVNWRLIMAPDAVRRSVVAHEVAHLAHFDHGPAFHAKLARIYEGEITQANRWLKREGRGLYLPFG